MKLLPARDVAKSLAVTPNTLAIWRTKGKGPEWVYRGNRVVYADEKVTEYLASLTQRREDGFNAPRRPD